MDRLPTPVFLGFPGGSDGEESASNVGNLGSIPQLGRSPGRGHGNTLQYSCLENPHGQKRLVSYSPWGGLQSMRSWTRLSDQAQHSSQLIHQLLILVGFLDGEAETPKRGLICSSHLASY